MCPVEIRVPLGSGACTQPAPFPLRVCDVYGVSSPRVPVSWQGWACYPQSREGGDQKGPPPSPMRAAVGAWPPVLPGPTPGDPEGPSPACCHPQVAQLPLFVSDGKWHHICVTWTTRDGMWEAFQDGEKLGTGENLAPWHPIKPGGVLILGQEQVSAAAGHTAHGCLPARGPAQPSACRTWPWSPRHDSQAGHLGSPLA